MLALCTPFLVAIRIVVYWPRSTKKHAFFSSAEQKRVSDKSAITSLYGSPKNYFRKDLIEYKLKLQKIRANTERKGG
jgi:hypothetical protein